MIDWWFPLDRHWGFTWGRGILWGRLGRHLWVGAGIKPAEGVGWIHGRDRYGQGYMIALFCSVGPLAFDMFWIDVRPMVASARE